MCKKSMTATAEPKRVMPTTDAALLARAKFLSARELPSITKSNALQALPSREKLRRLKQDPKPKQSNTASWLPNFPMPNTETALPMRASCRRLKLLPRLK